MYPYYDFINFLGNCTDKVVYFFRFLCSDQLWKLKSPLLLQYFIFSRFSLLISRWRSSQEADLAILQNNCIMHVRKAMDAATTDHSFTSVLYIYCLGVKLLVSTIFPLVWNLFQPNLIETSLYGQNIQVFGIYRLN